MHRDVSCPVTLRLGDEERSKHHLREAFATALAADRKSFPTFKRALRRVRHGAEIHEHRFLRFCDLPFERQLPARRFDFRLSFVALAGGAFPIVELAAQHEENKVGDGRLAGPILAADDVDALMK